MTRWLVKTLGVQTPEVTVVKADFLEFEGSFVRFFEQHDVAGTTKVKNVLTHAFSNVMHVERFEEVE